MLIIIKPGARIRIDRISWFLCPEPALVVSSSHSSSRCSLLCSDAGCELLYPPQEIMLCGDGDGDGDGLQL